jgi:excinuclease UvrABC nuclease subunit
MKEFLDAALFIVQPENAGIYFLLQGEKIVYIGQSTNIYARVCSHITEGKKTFDNVRVYYTNKNLDGLERKLINHYLPLYNNDSKTRMIKNKGGTVSIGMHKRLKV